MIDDRHMQSNNLLIQNIKYIVMLHNINIRKECFCSSI